MARRMFLERRTYRLHRLQDAARLLPVLALILFFGPIFIRGDLDGGLSLSVGLVYYVVVWAGLIVLTALLSRALSRVTHAPRRRKSQAEQAGQGAGKPPRGR